MRLIDADALEVRQFESVYDAVMCIREAQTIDATPVVRCKECEDYNTTGCSKGFGWCESMDMGVSDDFYCSCGAKMEDRP